MNDNLVTRVGEAITKFGGGYTATDAIERLNSLSLDGLGEAAGRDGGILAKLDVPVGFAGSTNYGTLQKPAPPYHHAISPLHIYRIRREAPLVANAIKELVGQTIDDGWTEWEKAYDAKCPACEEEFNGFEAFRRQMGEVGEELDDDEIDLDSERPCPECETVVEMMEPDESVKEYADDFLNRANARDEDEAHVDLEPSEQSSISQTMLAVIEEISRDICSFDDGWLLIERNYLLDEEGVIIDYEPRGFYRGPPENMRKSINSETMEPGGEYWVCINCRANEEHYSARTEPGRCETCGNETYEAYAYALDAPNGTPTEWFIRGEFVHDSMFAPGRWYGYSCIYTLWNEARTLEQMDDWYHDAYEERRAPRGVLALQTQRDEDLREISRKQVQQMREDPNYIPLVLSDPESEGDPVEFIELLQDPANMQHMEMREWMLDRISAMYGVKSILMSSSPEESGLSQSLEVEVSQKMADRLRKRLNRTFVPAILAQIDVEGWEIEIAEVLDEDEEQEAQLVGQNLNNAEKALKLGREVEWTEDDRADIKHGELTEPEEASEGPIEMGGMMGGIPEETGPDAGTLEPGESPNEPTAEFPGERSEDMENPDRPSAQPIKADLSGVGGETNLEKLAGEIYA